MPGQVRHRRIVYHVIPNATAEGWVVSEEKGDFRREFNTKEEAERFAREKAQQEEAAQVKVHGDDGDMGDE